MRLLDAVRARKGKGEVGECVYGCRGEYGKPVCGLRVRKDEESKENNLRVRFKFCWGDVGLLGAVEVCRGEGKLGKGLQKVRQACAGFYDWQYWGKT